jgi:hypothetical protein
VTGLGHVQQAELPAVIGVLEARLADGRIQFEQSDRELAAALDGGQVVILKGAFRAARLLDVRRKISAWTSTQPVFPRGESANRPHLNFHRIDDGTAKSLVPHISQICGFGNVRALPEPLHTDISTISSCLLDLQARLTGTRFDVHSSDIKTIIGRIPRGGGHQAPHKHAYQPQKYLSALNMSQPGVDYETGGMSFKVGDHWLASTDQHRAGDVVLFRADLFHGIDPVDADAALDWGRTDGYWLYSVERFETYAGTVLY